LLASSSAGNSTFIGTNRTRILIDAGLSAKQISARLAAIGEDPARLDAILITHEHSDHVAGLPVLVRQLGCRIPVFLTRLAAQTIDWTGTPNPPVEQFQAGAGFDLGDLSIQSFTIPHDSVDPVGFTLKANGIKVAIATDLGYLPDSVKYQIQGSHFLLLESNHHPELLKVGPYPWHIKQRILSRKGHLSNDAASEYIAQDLSNDTQALVLGHLSEQNNTVWDAELAARQALERRGVQPRLVVQKPRQQGELFIL
jgi:phosphoribosyl 1,2-cyclic phosphodiesterase